MTPSHWQSLPYAHGGPVATGTLKSIPEDFVVDEILGLEPDGAGEHLCVQVRARGQNTAWLEKALASWAQAPRQQVSFSGQKDRHAVTTQWFSIQLPGKPDPDPALFASEGASILQMGRHSRKIRTGTHWGNRFAIRIRNLQWLEGNGEEQLLQRLDAIASHGVPNYFGSQRFGRGEANLTKAFDAVSKGRPPRDRDQRGWVFSALRSYLFNLWLADRVKSDTWHRWVPGDLLQRAGRRGFFVPEQMDEETAERIARHELVPAGVLPGEESLPMQADALAAVEAAWAEHAASLAFLARQRLSQEVRSAALFAENFQYSLEGSDLRLEFALPRGSFATALAREIICDAGITPE